MPGGTLQQISQLFERAMLYLIAAAIVLGIMFGLSAPHLTTGLKIYINFTLFLMLYPMMVGTRIDEIVQAAKNLPAVSWSVVFNFVVSPLIGFVLAVTLLKGSPSLAAGLLLLSAAPCAGMVVSWTGLAKGNVPLSLVIVALSLTISIVTIPLTMLILGGSLITVDAASIFKGTLFVILIPLLAGDITRRIIIAVKGKTGFQSVRPILPPLSMLGMFMIIFISVAMGTPRILAQWQLVLLIIPALVLFYLLQMTLSIGLTLRLGFSHHDSAAIIYSVAGKNIPLAIGLASQFFSPLTVTMLAINPLIQAPTMAWFLGWSKRHWELSDNQSVPVAEQRKINERSTP